MFLSDTVTLNVWKWLKKKRRNFYSIALTVFWQYHTRENFNNCSDDLTPWPEVSYGDLINYVVFSVGVRGEELRNYNKHRSI